MHRLLPLLLLLLVPSPASADARPSQPVLLEAEGPENKVKIKRVPDDTASAGRYVLSDKPYGLLFSASLPPDGESFTIWARHRGHPVQLKTLSADGKTQIEFDWAWHKGPDWRWSKLGTHSRAALGSSILLIRGPGKHADAGLDAVILSGDPDFVPLPSPAP